MKTVYKAFTAESGSPLAEAQAAIKLARVGPGEKPYLIGFTPVGRTNPYQALLYDTVGEFGTATTPIVNSWSFDKLLRVASQTERLIIHVHWTSFVLSGVESREVALHKIADLREKIERLRSGGAAIVWTLHNIVPHDTRFPDLELEVEQFLADTADVIHALSYGSLEVMDQYLTVDRSKVIVVPHPNYTRAYEDFVSREDARLAFGIDPDERVYVLLGALKRYKGLPRLLEAFDQFCAEDPSIPRRLLIGGMPDKDDHEVTDFVAACEKHPRVLIEAKKIASNFVHYYMRAADVGYAAYTRMLNSGAVLLYQSFDLPVITLDNPALWESMTDDIGQRVNTSDVGGILDGFRGAERFFEQPVNRQVRRYVSQFDPTPLSRSFVSQVLARVAE